MSTRSTMESPISSELNDEESEKDLDFLEEYDSEEEKKQKKKRKVTHKSHVTSNSRSCDYQTSPVIKTHN